MTGRQRDAGTSAGHLLRLDGVSKRFAGTVALQDVSMTVAPGAVHALLGENGAGKSTLIKIVSGVHQQDEGAVWIDGRPARLRTPRDAKRAGISTVFQEFSLVGTLSVEENLMLGRHPTRHGLVRRSVMRERTHAMLAQANVSLPLDARVSSLTRADQQLVEIAKGLGAEARLLILDEPTASLTAKETERLFRLIRTIRSQGRSVVYITHRLEEIAEIADEVTVLRDGMTVTSGPSDMSRDELIEAMTGQDPRASRPASRESISEDVGLELRGVRSPRLDHVDLDVRRGEIVGIGGLVDSGKSELGRALYGLHRLTDGEVRVDGHRLRGGSPRRALAQGIVYYTSDRGREGLVHRASVESNITMGGDRATGLVGRGGRFRRREAARRAQQIADRLGIRARSIHQPVFELSGGNQQKVVLSRGFVRPAHVHVFDEPTVGVDVGARQEIYSLIEELAAEHSAVLVISSDLEELAAVCDRVCFMSSGALVGEVAGHDVSSRDALEHFFGGTP